MLFASTALVAAVLFPAQSADPDEREVLISGTDINICVVANVEVLDEITANLGAQVQARVGELSDEEFVDLKALCDEPSAPPTQVVPAPPADVEVLPPAGGGGGGGTQVTQVPRGAPETGGGPAASLVPLGAGMLALIGVPVALGLHARRQAPARR